LLVMNLLQISVMYIRNYVQLNKQTGKGNAMKEYVFLIGVTALSVSKPPHSRGF
jgi:hypothetical protein